MTPEQKTLIQHSFQKIKPQAEMAGGLFYSRLFVMQPRLKLLFQGDAQAQRRKLIEMLDIMVRQVNDETNLTRVLKALGRRHAGYGVQAAHFEPVGQALEWTLEQMLGSDFNPATRMAWQEFYGLAVREMNQAISQN